MDPDRGFQAPSTPLARKIPRPLAGLALALLLGSSCTVVKPVTCALVHPVRGVAELVEEAADTPEEPDDLPTAGALVEVPVILPVFLVYKSFVGAVGGLVSGLVSDLNVVTGHASWDRTVENLTRPGKTNARD